jgi:hypothetical protein
VRKRGAGLHVCIDCGVERSAFLGGTCFDCAKLRLDRIEAERREEYDGRDRKRHRKRRQRSSITSR